MNAPHKPEPEAPSDLPDISERPPFFGTGVIYPAGAKTEAERVAALERFLSLGGRGHKSDGVKMTRDEMHERW